MRGRDARPVPAPGRPGRFVLLLAALSLAACGREPPGPDPLEGVDAAFTFGVLGDLPYSERNEARFPELVASLEGQDPDFVIHVGDFKGGSTPCTDSIFQQRKAALAVVDLPIVYVPGDNEWTDCHRSADRAPGEPLERLETLRRTFYPDPGSATVGGRPMAVEQQIDDTAWAAFPEHQRWRRHGVVFATLHVVGSLNGLEDFDGRTEAYDAEVDRRIEAAVAWLRDAFGQARMSGAPGVVVAIHGDPWNVPGRPPRSGFEEVLAALAEEALGFGGPVLLVHGDTHTFRVDHPLLDTSGNPVPNVTRLETYGDPDMGWVEVGVDPDGPQVFTVAGRLLGRSR